MPAWLPSLVGRLVPSPAPEKFETPSLWSEAHTNICRHLGSVVVLVVVVVVLLPVLVVVVVGVV